MGAPCATAFTVFRFAAEGIKALVKLSHVSLLNKDRYPTYCHQSWLPDSVCRTTAVQPGGRNPSAPWPC